MDLDANHLESISYSDDPSFLLSFKPVVLGVAENDFPTVLEELEYDLAMSFSIVIINY